MKTIPLEKAVSIALEQHNAGNFERAEYLYLEILRQDPGNIDAMHLLGVLAHQGKNSRAAAQLIRTAISRRDDVPIFHYNLGEALRTLKENAPAIAAYRRAIELAPDYCEAHNNLSIVLNEEKDFENAEKSARIAVELRPEEAGPHNNLGNALRGLGRWGEAEVAYRKAIELRPNFAECINNLATLLSMVGRFEDSLALFRSAVQVMPTAAYLHTNLGAAYCRLNRYEEAADCFHQALELDPQSVEANNNLGAALRSMAHHQHAIKYFEKAIELDPKLFGAYVNLAASFKELGKHEKSLETLDKSLTVEPNHPRALFMRAMLLRDTGRYDEAAEVLRQILQKTPDDGQTLTALGYTLLERGEPEEAMKCLKRSIELNPDPQTHSNVLMTINYHPGYSPADLLAAHQSWAELHEKPHRASWPKHTNTLDPDRKLRVGYVSPDFRGHVVAHFLEPILDHHNHEQFEIYGYAQITAADAHTWRLRSQIDHWREIAQLNPDQVASMIRDDQIDILVELAGHTGGNALPVVARKPAPIQINMIGFPSTTGLSAIDYRITDALCDPPGVTDAFNSESLIRMPGLFWCYQPSEVAPEVGPLPADENGIITFTSVNNFTKVTPQVQHLWAQLLLAVPKSKLILQTAALTSKHTQKTVTAIFAEHGIPAERLDFRVWSDTYNYFRLLTESDMTLDPFPFNGGTTTCHSLWMGTPVITLAGDRHASRMGLSMLTAIGLPEFVAHTPEEYVQIGVRFANDLPRLRAIRAGMRERLLASPLLDATGYVKNLESAYRDIWKTYCRENA